MREPVPEVPGIFDAIRDWFFGGNLVVRVGVIVLFIGVGFLLKFAVERNLLPIELRLTGAALGGIALLVIGWRLRERLRGYSLALQGGGVGLLYLTAFAALRFYDLLPATATFAMLVGVAVLAAVLAVRQDAMVLAMLGALGGYLAPILTSTGEGNHVVLFSFYALLNAGIVAIAWFKSWRPLNLQAFVFTYGIGTAWGVLEYSPENFATTEPFVVLFFLMFLAVSVLFALRTAPRLTDYVDGTLVFGTPVATMLLQSALVHDREYGMAWSAFVLGVAYLSLARGLWRLIDLRMLAESFLALGVAFLTLAVPLAFDGHWTAGAWALEGAAILWIGLRQRRALAVFSGVLLQLGAAASYAIGHDAAQSTVPLANTEFLGALLIALGGFITSRVAHRMREDLSDDFAWLRTIPFHWGLVWLSFGAVNEIFEFVRDGRQLHALVAFVTATALGCALLSRWDDWEAPRRPTGLLLPLLILFACAEFSEHDHWLRGAGIFVWPLALVAWVALLRWRESRPGRFESALHVATLWSGVAFVAGELAWQVGPDARTWQRIVLGIVPTVALAALLSPAVRGRWPVQSNAGAYSGVGALGLAAYLGLWALVMNRDPAAAGPLPYLPLLNGVEIAQIAALAAIGGWLRALGGEGEERWAPQDLRRALLASWFVAVFAFVNAVLLRAIHHGAGIAYDMSALMSSTLVQASLSLFWGLLALGCMVVGTRRAERTVWFVGAWLLGVTLVKMFLVDLSRTGTVARIVSFIGVGVLMLIIGRFSPVPPVHDEDQASRAGRKATAKVP